ncbi:hypothetical protein [Cupriavidus plantarum]|uniref:Lipoprotein n=1 Tax=Cupriavidus plantarum TaxID=942865 RepID=A0A316EZJ0_9BURK|nr:hypothetical protein [Cupriavidus plantarum]PWK37791.1 hypothetical protein C7419_1011677 [Cupriavidus plantarum]
MKTKLLLATIAAAALSACGGGGSDSTATPASVTTKVSGTAAVGAALANAQVVAKCAAGGGTATTAADGTYTLNIADAKRPCVLTVTSADGSTKLHSVIEAGTGTSVVANITPLTELLTASLAGGDTQAFFDTFDAAAQAKLTAAGLTGAMETVRLVLTGTVDLTGIDPLKDTLVAAHGSTPGNALDQRLDTLGAALTTAKTSLADLSAAVGGTKGSTDGVKGLLSPASATCASYRSGKYQKVDLTTNTVQRYTVDAVAMTRVNDATGAIDQFAANPNEYCRVGNTDIRLLVSKSGIGLERRSGLPSLLIPVQNVPLAELAGSWIAMAFERDTSPGNYASSLSQFTLNAAGKFTAGVECDKNGCNQPWDANDLPTATVNADGGFNVTDSGGVTRGFAFKNSDGQMALVLVHANGFVLARQAIPRVLPAVGTKNVYWDANVGPTGLTDITAFSNQVLSVDPATSSYVRTRIEDGRVETFTDNKPFPGVRYRPEVAAVNGAGGASEMIGMSLANTGLTAAINVNPANPFFSISVDRPNPIGPATQAQ